MTPAPAPAASPVKDATPTPAPSAAEHGFPPTAWTTIVRAQSAPEEERFAALQRLCERYEPAIRRCFRRATGAGASVDELVQDFFADRFLRPQFLANLERDGGRFRDFIRVCIRNFCRTHWQREQRHAARFIHGDVLLEDLPDPRSPEAHLDAEWAQEILALARERLRGEALAAGHSPLFEHFCRQCDDHQPLAPIAELARTLGKSENAVSVGLHRLRERFGWLLFDEIRQTVPDPTRWKEERDHLLAALSPP